MLDNIKEAFSQFPFLNPKDLLLIASSVKIKTIKKDEYLIKEGELNYQVVMVLKGLFRHYIIDKNGLDKTILFVPEKKMTGSSATYLHHHPSTENVVALEDSLVLMMDNRVFDKIAANNIRLLKMQNQALKQIISSNVDNIAFLTVYTPEERYAYFSKTYPDLEQRIKQKHLSSYLGITATSLSRIRARMLKS